MTEALPRRKMPAAGRIVAITLFLAVYAGTLVVLFGPKDMIQARPGAMVYSLD